jgi:hypothetical protein
VVVPVTAATAYGWSAVARTTQRQVRSELELARASAQVAFDDRLRRARDAVAALARDPDLLRAHGRRGTPARCGPCSAARARPTSSWP